MTSPDTSGAGHALTKKVGPLPGFAYVIIAVGLVVAYKWYRSRSASAQPAIADGTATSAVPDSPIASSGGTGIVQTPNGSPSPQTDATWASMAASALVAKGLDVTAVENALNSFINGQALTPQQEAIVQQAITTQGQPPEGVLPIITTPTPTPATAHTYVVQPGDTLTSISEHFFGDPNQAWRIVAANTGVQIHRGATITVPVPLSANQYAIAPGDTWQSVSMRFYGNTQHVPALKAANPGVTFQRGQTLRIP